MSESRRGSGGRDTASGRLAPWRLPWRALLALLVSLCAAGAVSAQQPAAEWVEVDYAELIDSRQPTHSGEPVGELLDRLGSTQGGPAGRAIYKLLDPLLEPFAFVLSDVLDTLDAAGPPDAPLVDVGGLWQPGAPEPAWVELLRARRYVVESDGRGRLRVCLPLDAAFDAAIPSEQAAREALDEAWPILRLVFAAERRRLAAVAGPDGAADASPPALNVEVHAYRHALGGTRFRLGTRPHRVVVDDTRPAGRRPPLDLEALQAFLREGLQVEGGRLEQDGALRLLGSRAAAAPRLAGRPPELADLAVAYRAVFHGGLAEPYMSLDRGLSPQAALVNYGGRLRDTSLGWVSLLCDIRFKTFSVGIDVLDGSDLRGTIRDDLAAFRTHYERFAAHPESGEVLDQQTRLWFYPDNVDLTVSRQGDLLAMRRVRMSAASERFVSGTTRAAASDPPWTRNTIDAVNRDYDALARFFPELADLDGVVRMLSLFTWLRQARADGLLLPELDLLLDVELPAASTPRTFPQLLSFNALPRGEGAVDVIDRLPVAAALDRLVQGARGALPARRRLERALAGLDPERPQSAKLLEQLRAVPLDGVAETRLDAMAYQAERVRMHQTVLGTLAATDRERVVARQRQGETMRYFSIGIGGLELGMENVLSRAGGRQLGLGAGSGTPVAAADDERVARSVAEPREPWRRDPSNAPGSTLPSHGWPDKREKGRVRTGDHWLERGGAAGQGWIMAVYGADGPEARSRRVVYEQGAVARIERLEGGAARSYRLERDGAHWSARTVGGERAPIWSPAMDPLPGLAVMQVGPPLSAAAVNEPPQVPLRLLAASPEGAPPRRMETAFPRRVLQRLLLGPQVDWTPGEPLPGFAPLPGGLEGIEAMMLSLNLEQRAAPWVPGEPAVAGEEDPESLARALNAWWGAAASGPYAVVGTDPVLSAARWADAPRVGAGIQLLLPPREAMVGAIPHDALVAAWSGGPVADTLPELISARVVVLVSDEAPGPLGGRLRRLAQLPAMQDKLLVIWSLRGPPRQDLPASLLAEGKLAGIAVAESGVLGGRDLEQRVAELGRRWTDPARAGRRVESIGLGLLWYF